MALRPEVEEEDDDLLLAPLAHSEEPAPCPHLFPRDDSHV
jgi:hypothetical protein